jgi:hypothetical protein
MSLILSMVFMFLPDFADAMECDEEGEDQEWPALVRVYAEKHAAPIEGVFDVQASVQQYSVDVLTEEDIKLVRKVPVRDKFKFKASVSD